MIRFLPYLGGAAQCCQFLFLLTECTGPTLSRWLDRTAPHRNWLRPPNPPPTVPLAYKILNSNTVVRNASTTSDWISSQPKQYLQHRPWHTQCQLS